MNVEILRADGRRESVNVARYREIGPLIGSRFLDSVSLRDGRVMLVDDLGHDKRLPVNAEATRLYRAVCRPGTTHQIVGDAAIIIESEVDV